MTSGTSTVTDSNVSPSVVVKDWGSPLRFAVSTVRSPSSAQSLNSVTSVGIDAVSTAVHTPATSRRARKSRRTPSMTAMPAASAPPSGSAQTSGSDVCSLGAGTTSAAHVRPSALARASGDDVRGPVGTADLRRADGHEAGGDGDGVVDGLATRPERQQAEVLPRATRAAHPQSEAARRAPRRRVVGGVSDRPEGDVGPVATADEAGSGRDDLRAGRCPGHAVGGGRPLRRCRP